MPSASKAVPGEALQQKAYTALSEVFAKYEPQEPGHETPHATIALEILPKSIEPPEGQLLLEDEGDRSIGVPKKVLVAAFLHARRLFMSAEPSEYESKEIAFAIKIILLYDPEFLTAANARKQYLRNILSMKQAYGPMHQMMLSFAVQGELWFLTSILVSPLHRQSKSPTLWYQRAWIYKTFVLECDFLFATREYLMAELDIILKAAERHQHNYYAFQYARRVLGPALYIVKQKEAIEVDGDVTQDYRAILEKLVAWCKAHPSDTSGWSFLAYWMEHAYVEPASLQTLQAVLKFALDMRWKGEALWSFLRTIAALDKFDASGKEDELSIQIRSAMAELCPRLIRSSAASERTPS